MKPFFGQKAFSQPHTQTKPVRKLFFGLAFLGAMAFSNTITIAQTDPSDPGFEEPCKDTITKKGNVITVTVCNRRTSILGGLAGVSCDEVATSSCSFNNL